MWHAWKHPPSDLCISVQSLSLIDVRLSCYLCWFCASSINLSVIIFMLTYMYILVIHEQLMKIDYILPALLVNTVLKMVSKNTWLFSDTFLIESPSRVTCHREDYSSWSVHVPFLSVAHATLAEYHIATYWWWQVLVGLNHNWSDSFTIPNISQ